MIVSSDRVLSNRPFNDAPIGIFDSGFGGLTVAREIAKELPEESIVYFGDTARCPYGPRSQDEVDGFVQQICTWLVGRDVKNAAKGGVELARETALAARDLKEALDDITAGMNLKELLK